MLERKIAFVTGSNRGIKGIAKNFAQNGAIVCANSKNLTISIHYQKRILVQVELYLCILILLIGRVRDAFIKSWMSKVELIV